MRLSVIVHTLLLMPKPKNNIELILKLNRRVLIDYKVTLYPTRYDYVQFQIDSKVYKNA